MGKYADLYSNAKEKEAAVPLTYEIVRWSEEGQTIVGKVLKIEPFYGSSNEVECDKYLVDTDDGLKSLVLGASTDKQLNGQVQAGMIVAITYRGKVALEGGRHVNRFDIRIIPEIGKGG